MPREKVIKVYQFEELSDKAKQRAMDWYREASYGDEWWESIYEDAENVGIKIKGFDCDRGNYIKGDFIRSAEYTANEIIKDHGTVCDTYKIAAKFLEKRKALDEKYNEDGGGHEEYNDLDSEFKRAILEEYLSMLRKEVEDYYSDERVTENILANEYEFDENGKRA